MKIFKSIILILAVITFSTAAMASTTPLNDEERIILVKSEQVMVSITNVADARAFNGITYSNITKMLRIDTKENIAFIEIINAQGELEYLMPVGAKKLNIDLLDFAEGTYTVKIKLQELGDRIINTTLSKTF